MENRSNGAGMAGAGIGGLFLGVVIGAVAGGVAVLLYAPKSGPETRALLRDEVNETQRMLQDWSDELQERVNRFSQIIRFRAEREMQPVGGDGKEGEC